MIRRVGWRKGKVLERKDNEKMKREKKEEEGRKGGVKEEEEGSREKGR